MLITRTVAIAKFWILQIMGKHLVSGKGEKTLSEESARYLN